MQRKPPASYTISRMYLALTRRQSTTRKAESGTASTMPIIPSNAEPQKKTEKIMAMGCRPVVFPMILGVRT